MPLIDIMPTSLSMQPEFCLVHTLITNEGHTYLSCNYLSKLKVQEVAKILRDHIYHKQKLLDGDFFKMMHTCRQNLNLCMQN